MTLRILFLAETFPPWPGGAEIHAHQLSSMLASKGAQVTVLTRKMYPTSADVEYLDNVLVRRISPQGDLKGKGWKALGPLFLFLVKIVYLLFKDRRTYSTLVVCGAKVLPFPAVLVSKMLRKNCIVRIEGPAELREDISEESLRERKLAYLSPLMKFVQKMRNAVLRKTEDVVAISPEIKQQLVSNGVALEKIRSIPNGIDTSKFTPVTNEEKRQLRQQLDLPVDATILIFTGRLAAGKGLPLLIQTWEKLRQKYEDIYLLLVGSGEGSYNSCEEEIRETIKNAQLERSIRITGEVANVHEYLQAADIFIFPSEYEGFGLSLIEALSAALPVVTTKVGVAEEVILPRENGLLVNPKDQREFQETIEWLLDHRDMWVALGRKGRQSVVEKYSLEAVAEKYLQICGELKETKRTTSSTESERKEV